MIAVPQRRQSPTRDEFAAAVSATFEELFGLYEAEPISEHTPPRASLGRSLHSVALPLEVAREGGAAHGIASIVKHAIEMKASEIGHITRVERDGLWIVYFEAK